MPTEFDLSELHTDAASQIAYRVREPQPQAPSHCLVLLHGVGSNEENLLDLATGVEADTLVVFARGPLVLGPQQFAWFRVSFTASGPSIVPEEAEQSRKQLITFLASLQRDHSLAPGKTVIAGFSQGGILSASVALSSPESVAGFAILSGRILPELEPHLATVNRLGHIKAFVGHGTHDSKLPVVWAERSDALLQRLEVQHVSLRYPIDHGISAAMQSDFIRWLRSLG
jgi:phospholipase/carboxylesterase